MKGNRSLGQEGKIPGDRNTSPPLRSAAKRPYQHHDGGDQARRFKHALQLSHWSHEEDGAKRQTHGHSDPNRTHQGHLASPGPQDAHGNKGSDLS